MIPLGLRDTLSPERSIEDMFPSPGSELLERSREKIRKWQYVAEGRAKQHTEELRKAKKGGEDEAGLSEHFAPSVLELAKVVKSPSSMIKDVGDDGTYWSLTVEGVDTLGNRLFVFLRLPKDENGVLQIVDFELTSGRN